LFEHRCPNEGLRHDFNPYHTISAFKPSLISVDFVAGDCDKYHHHQGNIQAKQPFQMAERERAALAWAEAVTRVSETGVPDEAFQAARSL
jgi:alkylhydroperoxidase family enzyme